MRNRSRIVVKYTFNIMGMLWLHKYLLAFGYAVKCACRSPADESCI